VLQHIAVEEFEVGPSVTAVSRYDASVDDLGQQTAKVVARYLKGSRSDAAVVPKGATPSGDLIVSGRVTRIDGGSRAGRIAVSLLFGFGLTSYGAGGATCGVEGEVRRADGSPVGSFSFEAKRKATGYFWVRYGESSERQITACLQSVAAQVAESVRTNHYQPRVAPVAAQARREGDRSTGQRLRELDKLRADGLVTEDEYQQRRKAILEQL
jgi:hypothetical protein